jgi:hypothetical protein
MERARVARRAGTSNYAFSAVDAVMVAIVQSEAEAMVAAQEVADREGRVIERA